MYYFVKGISRDVDGGSFEWVIEAESKEKALAELCETDEVLEIREISLDERISREEKELFENIKSEYLIRRYGNLCVREYAKVQKQMRADKEMYCKALEEHNKIMRFKRRLLRYIDKEKITVSNFSKALIALCDAQTEEEFNSVLEKVKKID